ncbi:hypothetical protein V6667_04640 [Neisseria leonii]|uniref:Lipoprotein n=1 Tax=Neisseria leonii TaxID=2995413 RepID=A0A9X4I9Z5_9NEIS|nr:hypothetical protein [Neisseria sp. 51.81]MDD9326859.1 hypothetical protein [Neisseria sp. 51.81]
MNMKTLWAGIFTLAALSLTGCANLETELRGIGTAAKDSAVTRAKMEAGMRASEATGKILRSKY